MTKFWLGAKRIGKQLQHSTSIWQKVALDPKEIIEQLEISTGIWPLTLCLEASDLQKPSFGVDVFAPMDKRGKKRMHEKTLFPTSILPKTVGKATQKNANQD